MISKGIGRVVATVALAWFCLQVQAFEGTWKVTEVTPDRGVVSSPFSDEEEGLQVHLSCEKDELQSIRVVSSRVWFDRPQRVDRQVREDQEIFVGGSRWYYLQQTSEYFELSRRVY